MIKLVVSKNFRKRYKERIRGNKKLVKRVEERIKLFIEDRYNPILKDHKLQGKYLGLGAFSIAGDLRIIYRENNEGEISIIDLLDIGTHNQVYE
jgi:mRNA interferase YafQ